MGTYEDKKREYNRKWRADHPNYRKDRYLKNKLKENEITKKWREENKKRYQETQKEWRVKNKDYIKECNKNYRIDNREQLKEIDYVKERSISGRYSNAKCSAKKRKLQFNLTKTEYEMLIKIGICHYCGNKLNETGSGLDRKNNDNVYSLETSVPCCCRCNSTFMNNYTYDEKMMLSETIKEIDKKRETGWI